MVAAKKPQDHDNAAMLMASEISTSSVIKLIETPKNAADSVVSVALVTLVVNFLKFAKRTYDGVVCLNILGVV